MNYIQYFVAELNKFMDEDDIKIDVPMKKYTSFKVGGNADVLITPKKYEDVSKIIDLCKINNINYYIVGNGSNILVKDGGLRGVVINLSKLNKITINGEELTAQGGASLGDVSIKSRDESLTGLEFACGIPGTVGGAVAMNAGAYNGEISDVIDSVLVMDNDGQILRLSSEKLELGYRTSIILKQNYIVLEASFKLQKGEYDKIAGRISDLMRRRREKQPLEYPSAGSTFKRPEGHFAAKLIQDSGLKGTQMGGAQVSDKHSGFIINKEDATAKDILDLIHFVQKTVKNKFNVELEPEVRIWGEDK
ncbi:UDP-N-acetylmuramate dehydrogenase [Clostridium guangxiense]|uniref:UDP-N-acetylmuramate dehydrogenase n=1 Tax=Clostridium guangxiense TaxID=1662055 RepID=UPI001E3AFA68|nr:UDP-N-acetylmuramate dehydrogenase [Clostridium guangxiense]MCD2346337.1 UDP-N-acetylmuramate dehydrogenase [Clostridium guangxiense]